jgi:hypothetical protein
MLLDIYRTEQYIPRPFAPGPHPLVPASRRRPRPSLRRLSSYLLYIIYIILNPRSARSPGGARPPPLGVAILSRPFAPRPAQPPPPPPLPGII